MFSRSNDEAFTALSFIQLAHRKDAELVEDIELKAATAVGKAGTAAVILRRSVPDDNDCLFHCMAYLGATAPQVAAGKRDEARNLRTYCKASVLKGDPLFDGLPNELVLERTSDEYAEWIMGAYNWGGEHEIIICAKKYNIEIAVVRCDQKPFSMLVYNENPKCRGRGFVLYTGKHYDPLVLPASFCFQTAAADISGSSCYLKTTSMNERRLVPQDEDMQLPNEAALKIAEAQFNYMAAGKREVQGALSAMVKLR
jgi:hypothetical protein